MMDEEGRRYVCKCGTCAVAGDHCLGGGVVLWFVWADAARRATGEWPSEGMYLRATCDVCGDTAREVLARENAAIPVLARENAAIPAEVG